MTASALAAVALSVAGMIADTAALADDDDRPVIKVPRGGGRELFTKNCVLCHKYDGRGGPRGRGPGQLPVMRGGGWDNLESFIRVSSRYNYYGDTLRVSDIGFRAVREQITQ